MWNSLNKKSMEKALDKVQTFIRKDKGLTKGFNLDEIDELNTYLCKQNDMLLKGLAH